MSTIAFDPEDLANVVVSLTDDEVLFQQKMLLKKNVSCDLMSDLIHMAKIAEKNQKAFKIRYREAPGFVSDEDTIRAEVLLLPTANRKAAFSTASMLDYNCDGLLDAEDLSWLLSAVSRIVRLDRDRSNGREERTMLALRALRTADAALTQAHDAIEAARSELQ